MSSSVLSVLAPLAGFAVHSVAMTALDRLTDRASAVAARDGLLRVVRYPIGWRLALGLAGGAWAGIALIEPSLSVLARVLMSAVAWALVVEVMVARYRIRPDGIERRTAWRLPGFVLWSEIRAVRMSPFGYVQLRDGRGVALRIHEGFDGAGTLAAAVLDRAPSPAVEADPQARYWLEQHAVRK